MRTIQVSTEVFAAIWGDRQEGEETEDQILRRKFDVPPKPENQVCDNRQGWHDQRYGASLNEGEEIFRTHKGTEYRARAENGLLRLLNTGARYRSLKELSDATVGHENAWTGWYYVDVNGRRRQMSDKRDPMRISRRRPATLEELV